MRRLWTLLFFAVAFAGCFGMDDIGLASPGTASALRPPSSDGGTAFPSPTAPGGRYVVGCSSAPGATVASGPSRRQVALTFDDGPSLTQTPAILRSLDRLHARATFFEEGRHIAGREALMRSILASGDEIGNHSYSHPRDPGFEQLAATNRRIREATGFTPCLFRPPYGLVDAKVVSAARRNRLEIVLWSLDSNDDRHSGVAGIRDTVRAGAAGGSIVLMHDGGHHPQTVSAVPEVVRDLRSRGLRLVTVTRLLGGRMFFGRPR